MNGISESITISKRRKISTDDERCFGQTNYGYCRECLLLDPPFYNDKIANKKRMLCQRHYKRFYAKNHCREEGCRRLRKDNDGLCSVHSKLLGKTKTCATAKCENPLKTRAKYCDKCYMRKYRQEKRGQKPDDPGESTSDTDSPRLCHTFGGGGGGGGEEEEEEEGEDSTDDRRDPTLLLPRDDEDDDREDTFSYPTMMEGPCLGEIVSPRQGPPSYIDTETFGQWIYIQSHEDRIYLSPGELGLLGNDSLSFDILCNVFTKGGFRESTKRKHDEATTMMVVKDHFLSKSKENTILT